MIAPTPAAAARPGIRKPDAPPAGVWDPGELRVPVVTGPNQPPTHALAPQAPARSASFTPADTASSKSAPFAPDTEPMPAAGFAAYLESATNPGPPSAEERLADAEARFARERDELLRQAAADIAAAEARGLAAGEAAGRAAERERLAAATGALVTAARSVAAAAAPWADALADNVAALACGIARHLLATAAEDPAAVRALVARALSTIPVGEPVRIRIAPADHEVLTSPASAGETPTGDPLAWAAPITWVPDAALQPGSCIVEGTTRIADGRAEAALARIYDALRTATRDAHAQAGTPAPVPTQTVEPAP